MAILGSQNGPYAFGMKKVRHRNATVTTIVNSPVFDKIVSDLENAFEYEIGYVPNGYEHRPDLISNIFYGSPKYWWLLMLVNSITDPSEGFLINQRILLPKVL